MDFRGIVLELPAGTNLSLIQASGTVLGSAQPAIQQIPGFFLKIGINTTIFAINSVTYNYMFRPFLVRPSSGWKHKNGRRNYIAMYDSQRYYGWGTRSRLQKWVFSNNDLYRLL
jgi:hypothetical protein